MNIVAYTLFNDPDPRCIACNAPLDVDREHKTVHCPACGWPENTPADYIVEPVSIHAAHAVQVLTVVPLTYGRARVTAASPAVHAFGIWEQAWDYPNAIEAVAAARRWVEAGLAGEPDRWERHQPSNRRRPGGDPKREEVRK